MTTPLITRLEEAAYLQEALAFQAQIADVEGKITTASVCREAAAYIAMLAASPQGEGEWITHDGGPTEAHDVLKLFATMIDHIEDWMDDDYCPSWSPFIPIAAYRKAAMLAASPQGEGSSADADTYRVTEGVKP